MVSSPKPKRPRRKQPEQGAIAKHPERERVEADLLRGVPVRVVMRKYGIGKDSCYRFLAKIPKATRAKHYAEALKPGANLDELRAQESEGLLLGLHAQRMRLLMFQDAAAERADDEMVTRLASQIHRNLELVGKYLGEFVSLSKVQVTTLTLTPEYMKLREILLTTLSRYPEARGEILAELRKLEALPPSKVPAGAQVVEAAPIAAVQVEAA